MTTIPIDEIRRDPLGCLHRVEAGESLLIMRGDRPVAELKPVADAATASNERAMRPYGLAAGQFVVRDDFDQPLPEDVLAEFDGR